jgi:hypothetical protein
MIYTSSSLLQQDEIECALLLLLMVLSHDVDYVDSKNYV